MKIHDGVAAPDPAKTTVSAASAAAVSTLKKAIASLNTNKAATCVTIRVMVGRTQLWSHCGVHKQTPSQISRDLNVVVW